MMCPYGNFKTYCTCYLKIFLLGYFINILGYKHIKITLIYMFFLEIVLYKQKSSKGVLEWVKSPTLIEKRTWPSPRCHILVVTSFQLFPWRFWWTSFLYLKSLWVIFFCARKTKLKKYSTLWFKRNFLD